MKNYFEMSNEELELELKKEKSVEYDAYWKFTRCAAKSCGSLVEQMSQASKNKRDIIKEIRRRKNAER